MIRFLMGILVGIFLSVGGTYALNAHMNRPSIEVQRCMDVYLEKDSNGVSLLDNPENDKLVKEAMGYWGVNSIKDLVRVRCEEWVKNGQEF
jgi:hypothetical protein